MTNSLPSPELAVRTDTRRSLWTWLLVGLALRFLLLPLAIHADTLAVYYRIGLMERGELSLLGFHLQALPMALHAGWVELTGVGVPAFAGIAWDDVTVERVRNVVVAEFTDPADEHAAVEALTLEPVTENVEENGYLFGRIGRPLPAFTLEPLRQGVMAPFQHRFDQPFLGSEIVVESHPGNTGIRDDRVDTGAVISLPVEPGFRCIQQAFTRRGSPS